MPRGTGEPLARASQIVDDDAIQAAVASLLRGGDEVARDTRARGWNNHHYGEGADAMKMWYEELSDIDEVISENVEVNPTKLPTGSLLEKLDSAVERLSSCYTLAVPNFQKRALHLHYDELSEVAGDLRAGKINAAEAGARFAQVMADVNEIVDFSNLFVGD
jgi:hypothetical protein